MKLLFDEDFFLFEAIHAAALQQMAVLTGVQFS